ncbi:MAG: ACT domain-containing protein [Desulfobulbus sp.]|jgi:acetolactate synthase-1/3 small subunit|uniref:ACT domain-containing protein n=1 Tax=Desulfobulbus sp. TaxID=895 RepID=UPI00284CBBFD|nr:ACT domain-containing protein [Desulfobulbus sp.]
MPATDADHADRMAAMPAGPTTVLRLTVNNHPGVMLQICGLFARRAFNLEGILCAAIGRGDTSRIWLTVDATDKLDQIVKQLAKLEDVLVIEERPEAREQVGAMAAMMARID